MLGREREGLIRFSPVWPAIGQRVRQDGGSDHSREASGELIVKKETGWQRRI